MWKNVLASGDVNDNLGMMSRQMMDEWQYVKSSESFIYIHMYIHKESQTSDQKSELQTFVVWKRKCRLDPEPPHIITNNPLFFSLFPHIL